MQEKHKWGKRNRFVCFTHKPHWIRLDFCKKKYISYDVLMSEFCEHTFRTGLATSVLSYEQRGRWEERNRARWRQRQRRVIISNTVLFWQLRSTPLALMSSYNPEPLHRTNGQKKRSLENTHCLHKDFYIPLMTHIVSKWPAERCDSRIFVWD